MILVYDKNMEFEIAYFFKTTKLFGQCLVNGFLQV